jgi:peptidoglycan hydrolase-like protein with peptidoglycan-binding domain
VISLRLFRYSEVATLHLKAHGTTQYFGTLTSNALKEFQKKAGIVPASGFFGPITRAYVNGLKK